MAPELELLQALVSSLWIVEEQEKELRYHKHLCTECEWGLLVDMDELERPCWRYTEIKNLISIHKTTADAHLQVWKEDYGTKARQT